MAEIEPDTPGSLIDNELSPEELQREAENTVRGISDTQLRSFLEQVQVTGDPAIAYKRVFPTSKIWIAQQRGPLLLHSARARAILHEMKREAPDNLDSEMVQVAVELARDRTLEPRDRLDAVKVYAALRKVGSVPAPEQPQGNAGLAAILAEIRGGE